LADFVGEGALAVSQHRGESSASLAGTRHRKSMALGLGGARSTLGHSITFRTLPHLPNRAILFLCVSPLNSRCLRRVLAHRQRRFADEIASRRQKLYGVIVAYEDMLRSDRLRLRPGGKDKIASIVPTPGIGDPRSASAANPRVAESIQFLNRAVDFVRSSPRLRGRKTRIPAPGSPAPLTTAGQSDATPSNPTPRRPPLPSQRAAACPPAEPELPATRKWSSNLYTNFSHGFKCTKTSWDLIEDAASAAHAIVAMALPTNRRYGGGPENPRFAGISAAAPRKKLRDITPTTICYPPQTVVGGAPRRIQIYGTAENTNGPARWCHLPRQGCADMLGMTRSTVT